MTECKPERCESCARAAAISAAWHQYYKHFRADWYAYLRPREEEHD